MSMTCSLKMIMQLVASLSGTTSVCKTSGRIKLIVSTSL